MYVPPQYVPHRYQLPLAQSAQLRQSRLSKDESGLLTAETSVIASETTSAGKKNLRYNYKRGYCHFLEILSKSEYVGRESRLGAKNLMELDNTMPYPEGFSLNSVSIRNAVKRLVVARTKSYGNFGKWFTMNQSTTR